MKKLAGNFPFKDSGEYGCIYNGVSVITVKSCTTGNGSSYIEPKHSE
jgi:hypothetical protein